MRPGQVLWLTASRARDLIDAQVVEAVAGPSERPVGGPAEKKFYGAVQFDRRIGFRKSIPRPGVAPQSFALPEVPVLPKVRSSRSGRRTKKAASASSL